MGSINIIIITVVISLLSKPSDLIKLVCNKPVVGATDSVVSVIQKEDVSEVMDLLRMSFFVDEPLNKAINLCPRGYGCPELEEYCRKDLLSGYSLKATDKEGVIVSVSISNLVSLKQGHNGDELYKQAQNTSNSKFQKILYILANREKQSKLAERYPYASNALEINVVATKKESRRRGLMTKLLNETIKIAQERNIKVVSMGTSNYYTAKGAEKSGFTLIYKELYSHIQMNGSPIIQPEEPHNDDRVYVKEF